MDLMFHLRLPALLSAKGFFRSAVWYALSDKDNEDIFAHDKVHVNDYIKGIGTLGCASRSTIIYYDAVEEAHKVFQN
jgi:hypothetical protein